MPPGTDLFRFSGKQASIVKGITDHTDGRKKDVKRKP